MKELSIVIPVFNNFNFTKNLLADLSHLPEEVEIIVVDNGSTDETALLENDRIKIIRNSDNNGFGFAANQGQAESVGKVICILNNDVKVVKDKSIWWKELVDQAQDGSIVCPTGGLLNENLHFIKEVDYFVDDPGFYLSGWCLSAKRETFKRLVENGNVGPFRSDLYFCYFEDTHCSFRAKELGIPLKVIKLPLHHFGRMTGKKLNLSKMYHESREKFIKIWGKNV